MVNLPALWSGFVWDDLAMRMGIQNHDQGFEGGEETTWIFRPLVAFMFAGETRLNDWIYGELPPGDNTAILDVKRARVFHVTSLMIHVFSSMAVALFIYCCLAERENALLGALFGGLVFAVHPVHTENAIWISALADSLATLFLVTALVTAYLGSTRKDPRLLIMCCILFLLALLSKETAITGVVLLPLFFWYKGVHKTEGGLGLRAPTLALLATTLVYFAARLFLSPLPSGCKRALSEVNFLEITKTCSFYFNKLIFPWTENPFITGPGQLSVSIIFIILAAAAAIHFSRRGENLYLFCMAWFFVSLSPAVLLLSNAFTVTQLAERYLYLPSVSFALAIGGLSTYAGWRLLVVSGLIVAFGTTSFTNTRIWRTDVTLWTHVVKGSESGKTALPWLNLSYGYYRLDDLDNAEKYAAISQQKNTKGDVNVTIKANRALGRINADRGARHAAAGNLQIAVGYYQTALGYYSANVNLEPDDIGTLEDAATIRARIAIINKARTARPDLGNLEQALKLFERAAALAPDNQEIKKNIVDLKNIGR